MANKQIKDFDLKESIDGEEDLLIQDSDGVTKRIKTSKLMDNLDLSEYATKDDLNTKADKIAIPTKVSQLTNDKQYLTSHQDISGKADKTYVDTELAKKSDKTHTHSYNNLTDKPTIPSTANLATKKELTDGLATKANKSEIPSLEGYATETYVQDKIAEASLSGGEADLSGLATKAELATKADKTAIPTKTSQLTNDSGFLTSVPSEYVTETELNAKGYLTEHQDISMKANKTELHTHSNKAVLDGITSAKVTKWDSKSDFDGNYNSLTNKPTIPTIPTSLPAKGGNADTVNNIHLVVLSQAEYDDLEVKDETTLYIIKG